MAAGKRNARKAQVSLEVEIKLRVEDARGVRARLRALGAKRLGRVHEMNTLFDTPEDSLCKRGALLRLRRESALEKKRGTKISGALLTYKGPAPGESDYKVREELEIAVSEPDALAQILQSIGLQPRFRYEKYRTSYRLPRLSGLHVYFDETPIGEFLELEGAPREIDRAAELLGYSRRDYITLSYGALYWAECARHGWPADRMLFATRKK